MKHGTRGLDQFLACFFRFFFGFSDHFNSSKKVPHPGIL
jgi:hypothetical protein